MAKLSGIEIYKLLPRTNCGDCGVPTCMAFAMRIAGQKASLDDCPHVSEEARSALGEAQTPPMATARIGAGETALEVGGETVLYRHEGRFHRPPVLALRIRADLDDNALRERIETMAGLRFERLGQDVGIDAVAIDRVEVEPRRFASVADRVAEATPRPLILMCDDPLALEPVAMNLASRHPLLWAADASNATGMIELAARTGAALVVRAEELDEITAITEQAASAGVGDLFLDLCGLTFGETLERSIATRRLALQARVRALGYPTILRVREGTSIAQMCDAIGAVARYASLVVFDALEAWVTLAIATARLNLYTDPQVPSAVEARLVEFGRPGRDAPVLVTTNFALTYFTVAGEVENAKQPAYLCVMDTDGLGVLNAYADQRLTAETLVAAIREQGAMERVDHNRLIIPGLLARLRMAIQELSGWDVLVGPEDASGIPRYLSDLITGEEDES